MSLALCEDALALVGVLLSQGLDVGALDLGACVTSPTDDSVSLSSVRVHRDSVSSIGGFDSRSAGFDLAVALSGESPYVEIKLTVSGSLDHLREKRSPTVFVCLLGAPLTLRSVTWVVASISGDGSRYLCAG